MRDVAPVFVPDPAVIESSQMTAFIRFCEQQAHVTLSDHAALHAFSVTEWPRFWQLFLEWSALEVEGDPHPAADGHDAERSRFFPHLRLSYPENLLRARGPEDDSRTAIIACSETGAVTRLTRAELRSTVLRAARALRSLGVTEGDRVVAIARNTPETIVACLGTAAIGASWSSTAPDLARDAILSRFAPLQPALLVANTEHVYHGVRRPILDTVREVAQALPSLKAVITMDRGVPAGTFPVATHDFDDLVASAAELGEWLRFPFNHPLFILFSSGTTGPPKCIVHGAGGTLLEHVKEHRLHTDLGPGDTLCFQTSAGWMMWNWQLSALAAGTAILLYDGSVSYPEPDSLLQVLDREEVTAFGTSPAYLQYLSDLDITPRDRFALRRLRLVQSTGSILFDAQYAWVKDRIKDIPVQSVSGGTDIVGCFVLGNPNLPVHAGESQCISLGLDVRAMRDGVAERTGTGELICVNPFPSRPLGLFNDPEGTRFHQAYFSQHPGVWTHGDFVHLSERGTARILGRSDGTLNIRGVRIGPAEIYTVMQEVSGVVASMAIEQRSAREPGGSRLILLVVLPAGTTLDRPLTLRIKKMLKECASLAHVPAVIAQVDELPTTFSGKRSERAATDALHGRPVLNAGALKNPESLERIRNHPALQLPQDPNAG